MRGDESVEHVGLVLGALAAGADAGVATNPVAGFPVLPGTAEAEKRRNSAEH